MDLFSPHLQYFRLILSPLLPSRLFSLSPYHTFFYMPVLLPLPFRSLISLPFFIWILSSYPDSYQVYGLCDFKLPSRSSRGLGYYAK